MIVRCRLSYNNSLSVIIESLRKEVDMPIYEFGCSKCGAEFEVMRPFSQSDEPYLCPSCNVEAERLVSVFASKVSFYLKAPEKGAFRKHETSGS